MRLSKKVMLSVGLFITLINLVIFFVVGKRLDNMFMKNLEATARAFYKQIVITRAWVAEQGGVFVKKRPGVSINPYLPEPYVCTLSGDTLVLRNPAMVTRELSELSHQMGKLFQFHITSLNPLNPHNEPSPFEKEALLAILEKREPNDYSEYMRVEKIGDNQVFRYFGPLFTEESCLKCHGDQGYQVGDIRGGISILIPMDDFIAARKRNILLMAAGGVAASIFVSFFIYLIFKRLIISPLYQLEQTANKIRHGNYSSPIGYLKDDEIGDLGRAMEKMQHAIHASTESILHSERKYRQLLRHSPEAILITNEHDEILEANENIARLSQYRVDELTGKPLSRILNLNKKVYYHVDDRDEERGDLFESEVICKDGETIPVEVAMVRHFAIRSHQTGRIYYLRDISGRKKMEEYMLQSEKMYALGQLSAGIAHEIRNPLFAIRNDLDYLRRQTPEESQYQEVYAEMEDGLMRVEKIVQSILDYAKPHPLSFDLYDLRDVIDKSLMLIRKQLQKNHIRIAVQVAEGLERVEMDAHQIEQVLMNLLTNAMRAVSQTGREGHIDISAVKKGRYAIIHIEDNGIGISKESLPHIFDPFYSLSSDGTGLGLTIARKIIEQHQGFIRVQSQLRQGTRFSIHLPLRQAKTIHQA